jgi:Domain of unknown function (DUF4349)
MPALGALRRPPLPVLAGAASVIAALAVAIPLLSEGEGDQVRTAGKRGGAAPSEKRSMPPAGSSEPAPGRDRAGLPQESGPGGDAMTVPPQRPGSGGFAPGARERRIERSASLTLTAPVDRLERVGDGVVAVTDRYGGFVLRSSLSTGDEGTTGGSYELRIPAQRLQPALHDLSELADVHARSQSGEDVTRAYVSAGDRLGAARAERRSLLRRLEAAPTDAKAEALRRRLDLNAGEISGLRAQLRDLRSRTNYATVTVTLQQPGDEGAGIVEPGGDGLRGALEDALGSLSGSVELLVRVLGVAVPLGLLTLATWLAGRALRRRRREAALR